MTDAGADVVDTALLLNAVPGPRGWISVQPHGPGAPAVWTRPHSPRLRGREDCLGLLGQLLHALLGGLLTGDDGLVGRSPGLLLDLLDLVGDLRLHRPLPEDRADLVAVALGELVVGAVVL